MSNNTAVILGIALFVTLMLGMIYLNIKSSDLEIKYAMENCYEQKTDQRGYRLWQKVDDCTPRK